MIFVPGRIEVLGKHTDYAGGRSLVCAIERGFHVDLLPRDDPRVIVSDLVRGIRVELTLGEVDRSAPGDLAEWSNYPRTVVRRITRNFPAARRGAEIAFRSDLPMASGLSSSSALMVAVFLALSSVNGLEQDAGYVEAIRSRGDLAAYLASVENGSDFGPLAGDRGVGTTGGSEDHVAMLCCRAGEISQYSFSPVRFERAIPLPEHLVFVVSVSGVIAEKTGSARDRYNRAATAAARVLREWQLGAGSADISLAEAVRSSPDGADLLRKIVSAPELTARLEHFVEESETIVPAAGDALAEGRLDEFGRLVDRSQELAERLLGNQVPETIFLARSAREHGALAATSFGAGFGGSVWALVERDREPVFVERWRAAYQARFPDAAARAAFFATRPAGPASET